METQQQTFLETDNISVKIKTIDSNEILVTLDKQSKIEDLKKEIEIVIFHFLTKSN